MFIQKEHIKFIKCDIKCFFVFLNAALKKKKNPEKKNVIFKKIWSSTTVFNIDLKK